MLLSSHIFSDSSLWCAPYHCGLGKLVEEWLPFPGAVFGAEALSTVLVSVGSHPLKWAALQGAWFSQEEHKRCKLGLGCAQPVLEKNPFPNVCLPPALFLPGKEVCFGGGMRL